MRKEEKSLIQDLFHLIEHIPDHRRNVFKLMDFLGRVVHTKSFVPPTTEIISVIRTRKPILFQVLKQSISPSSPLFMMLQINIDYDEALKRLHFIMNDTPSQEDEYQ